MTLSPAKQELLRQRLSRGRTPSAAMARREPGTDPPLSYAQERLWFMEQFAPGTSAYGSPLQMRFGPRFDPADLAAALTDLVARHESLRMRFPATEDGRPTVAVDPPAPVELPVVDADDPAALLMSLAARPFDLAAGPVLRPAAVRHTDGSGYTVLLDLHHIATDGWSNELLLADLGTLYAARRDGRTVALPELPVAYGDFAAWQRQWLSGPAAAGHVAYWLEQLRGVAALEVPTDAPRPPKQTFDGRSHHFVIDAQMSAALADLGRAHGATLFMTLLAAWQALLSRYSGQTDFAIGSPVAGRSRPELDGVVGMFVNMLPLRADLSGDPAVAELLGRARATVLDALAHQDVPFEKVINDLGVVRDVSRPPLFQTMLVLQNYAMESGTDEVLSWRPVDLPSTRFDLEWHAYADRTGALNCRLVFNTALFTAPTIERMAAHLRTLLADMVARPKAQLSDLELAGAAERAEIARWNATAVEYPDTTLTALLAAQVARTPTAIAAVDDATRLTYAQLDAAANRIAARLLKQGVTRDDAVGVHVQRGVRLIVALLGVLKARAAYLPLDPDYPADRIDYTLRDSGAAAVLRDADLAGVLSIDDIPAVDMPAVEPAGRPEDAAYMIYTSGSTGLPKGVVNEHRGIVNRLLWMQSAYALGPDDVVLQKTPAGFDVSVWEFFWPLITGARLVLARPGGHRDPAYLREVIAEHGVTTVHFVPSMLATFLGDADPAEIAAATASLRRIVCSGEELPIALARRTLEVIPHATLSNLYGPTEAAVDVTAFRCTRESLAGRSRVPIGGPIANVTIHILDRHGRPTPVGALGELHIGGVQVARGYHDRPELTAQRFLTGPEGEPRYATGDLARWRPDGVVEFLGRADGQIKLRGLRIELGEIEAALAAQPRVEGAAAAVKEFTPGDRRIIGYLVPEKGPDIDAVRAALARVLPDYMVPSAFVTLDELPLSANGKLDRAALPMPELGRSDTELVEPRTETEYAIAAIWCEVLGIPSVGVHDDFFKLGGHSLLATQVVARMRKITEGTGHRIGVMDLFQHPTIAGLAALVESPDTAPRRLLHELTQPLSGTPIRTYVCIPYGGGSAAVYRTVAELLPAGHRLMSLAIPGNDVGLDETAVDFEELAQQCAAEVLERTGGPLVLYGHCGIGGAMVIALALQLEAAGRTIEAVYAGGVFPSARPAGVLARLHMFFERIASDRNHGNFLKSLGVDVDGLGPEQVDRVVANMRHDSDQAEEYFTGLLAGGRARLRAPIIAIAGERDPLTEYYAERYREWRAFTATAALVVLPEGGHYFLRYRAREVVEILTSVHDHIASPSPSAPPTPESPSASTPPSMESPSAARSGAESAPGSRRAPGSGPAPGSGSAPGVPALGGRGWELVGVAREGDRSDPGRPAGASLRRFAAVAAGQLVSSTGSALTAFAIPIWVLQHTGSLLFYGLMAALAFLPLVVATPIAGAVADRYDRRKVMMAACIAAVSAEAVFGVLLWTRGSVALGAVYTFVFAISLAGAFQRITFVTAIPQLVPKAYLGHANGMAQMVTGAAMMFAPLLGAGLYAAIGLGGILVIDLASYLFAITVLLAIRFPDLLGRLRRETFSAQLLGGLRLTWADRHFRAMLIFYALLNLVFAVPLLMVTPLVLAFGTMADVGWAAFAEAAGSVVGGLLMVLWGGPRRRMMIVNILAIVVTGLFVAAAGLHASLAVVAGGVFGSAVALGIANAIYFTVIQVKIPQRYHGRVLALNQTLAWSTFPLGFAVLPPLIERYLEGPMARGGALADAVGPLLGTGPGRGIGLAFVIAGLLMAGGSLLGLTVRRLARLDSDVPDALADDLVGVRELAAQTGGSR